MSSVTEMDEPTEFEPMDEFETEDDTELEMNERPKLVLGSLMAEISDLGPADGLGFEQPVEASGVYLGAPFGLRLERQDAATLLQLLEPRLTQEDLRKADGGEIAATLIALLGDRNGLPAPEALDFALGGGTDFSEARHLSLDLGAETINAAVILPPSLAEKLDQNDDFGDPEVSWDDEPDEDGLSDDEAGTELPFRIELLRYSFTQAAFDALEEGDMIQPRDLDPRRGRAIFEGDMAAMCRREGGEFTLEEAPSAYEPPEPTENRVDVSITAMDELFLSRPIEECDAGDVIAEFPDDDASVMLLRDNETIGMGTLVLYKDQPAIVIDVLFDRGDAE